MNNKLPEIVCRKCNLVQIFRGQYACIHCSKKLDVMDVARQLQQQAIKKG